MSQDRTARIRALLDEAVSLLDEHAGEQWARIDPRDLSAYDKAVARHRELLTEIKQFRTSVDSLLNALGASQGQRQVERPTTDSDRSSVASKSPRRPPRSTDPTVSHSLDRDYIGAKPAAIQIGDTVHEVPSWRRAYELVCKEMLERDPDRFSRLPSNPRFISDQDRHDFSRDPRTLRTTSEVAPGIFAEVHFNSNSIRDRIARLLEEFGLPKSSVRIYLLSERAT